MTQYEIFSDQLNHYEETVEKIFQSPLPDSTKTGENVLRHGFKKPKHNYLICFTNRSGSTLLAMTLAKTDAMGMPGEMFNPEPLTQARQKHGIASFNDFIDFKIQSTTKRGAFGAKVGIHQLAYLAKHGYLKDKLSSPKFIYITRKDIVMQAVSLYLAWETGAWSSNARNATKNPEYSMEGIAQQLKSILTIQAQFEAFFAAHQIQPLRLTYEAIEADLEAKALHVCRYVGIPHPRQLQFTYPGLKKQRTDLNEEWAARFIAEYKETLMPSIKAAND
jgi:trehalose 2-sulfotransferase